MQPNMRSPKKAAEDDRRTGWKVAQESLSNQEDVVSEDVIAWIEEGRDMPEPNEAYFLAAKIAAALKDERNRVALEVALTLGKGGEFSKNDHVRVHDPRSKHYGKSGLVWFVRDGRVMVSMAEPRSIGGSVSDSFIPEHLEKLEDPVPVNLERAVLLRFMRENAEMQENLTATQERCTVLLFATRSMRQKIVELGGDDPGAP